MNESTLMDRTPACNRRLAKKRVQCLNEALYFVSSSVLAESLVLRNPLLRQAPKRYRLCLRSSGFQQKRRSTKAPISYLSGRIWERNWVLIFSLTS